MIVNNVLDYIGIVTYSDCDRIRNMNCGLSHLWEENVTFFGHRSLIPIQCRQIGL